MTFHSGAAFTGEDIAYTLARVPTVKNSPGSFLLFTRSVIKTEVVDPLTIRLTTRTVTPPRVGDDEAAEDYPPTHAFDHATPTPVVPADTGATPTPATTTEASTTTETPAPTTAES